MAATIERFQSKNVGRRKLLGGIAAGAAGFVAGSGLGVPFVHAGSQNRQLTYSCNGVTAFQDIATRAKQDLGIEINFQVHSNIELLKLAVTQPNRLELLEIAYDSLPFLIDLNKIRGIATDRLQNLSAISPVFFPGNSGPKPPAADGLAPSDICHINQEVAGRPTREASGWLSAIPVTFNADSLGALVQDSQPAISRWKALVSPEYAGRTALTGIPSIGIIDAAMALESNGERRYGNKSNMTREDITFTVNRLIALKKQGHFKGTWQSFPESVDLMLNQGVVLQSMWAPAITRVRSQDVPCRMLDLEEGYRGWARGLTLPRNISDYKRDLAYEFFNWYLNGYPGAIISRQGYYSTVPAMTKQHMSEADWDYWYGGKAAKDDILSPDGSIIDRPGTVRSGGSIDSRVRKIVCWNSFMSEHRFLRREWQRFLEV